MTSRRDFIRQISLLAAGASVLPMAGCQLKKKNIGLQLYTLRDMMKENPFQTLEAVSKIGYTWLELAGYGDGMFYGIDPVEFKTKANDLGMQVVASGTHVDYDVNNLDELYRIAEAHAKLGVDYIVKPSLPKDSRGSLDGYLKWAEKLNKIGEVMKKYKIATLYHNHAFEFEMLEDKIPYEVLLENTDKEYVNMEFDLYWVTKAEVNPIELINNNPGRFSVFHIKDMDNSPEKKITEVGNGVINFENIFAKSDVAGMKHHFVEQDSCINHKPIESVTISYNHLVNQSYI